MKVKLFPVVVLTLLALTSTVRAVEKVASEKPKLVLQITIDQMRGE